MPDPRSDWTKKSSSATTAKKFVATQKKQFAVSPLTDLKESISNVPRGVVGLGEAAYRTAQSTVEDTDWSNPLDIVKLVNPVVGLSLLAAQQGSKAVGLGKLPAALQPSRALEKQAKTLGGSFFGNVNKEDAERYPLLAGQGTSFRNTYNRLSDPEKLVSDYGSRPFSSLAEDAANVSVVAAPAGAALKGAGLVKAGTAVSKANAAFEKIGQGPFLPVSATARGANKLISGVARQAGKSERVQGALSSLRLDAGSRQVKRTLTEGRDAVAAVQNRQARLGRQLTHILKTPVEQEAAQIVGEGTHLGLAQLRKADPEGFVRAVEELPGNVTVKAASLAADIADGTNVQAAERVTRALNLGRDATGGRVEREAYQLSRGMNPEQAGNQPLTQAVAAKTGPVNKQLAQATKLSDRLQTKLAAAQVKPISARRQVLLEDAASRADKAVERLGGKATSTEAKVLSSVEAMPARYRPAATINRSIASHLTETENALRSAGLTDEAANVGRIAEQIPTTLEAFRAQGIDPEHFIHVNFDAKPSSGVSATSFPSVRGKTRSQRVRKNSVFSDRSIPAQAKAEAGEFIAGIKQATVDEIGKLPLARRTDNFTPAQLEADGYVPVTAGSDVYVPEAVKKAFTGYFNPKSPTGIAGMMLGAYDKSMQAFKLTVLPLSPSWQVGNMLGNGFLGVVGAGVDPVTLGKNIITAIREYRKSGPRGLREFQGPDRLYQSGSTFESLDFMNPSAKGNRFTRAAGAVPNVGYRANQFIDNLGRTAVYMAKKQSGKSDALALREALRAMGDFSNLSPFEKNFVRRVVPFYAWQKHMTKLAFTLPIEHPLRTAWTLNLANEYGQPEAWVRGLPDFLQGIVPIGEDGELSTSSLFPFPTNPLESLTSASGAFRNVAPQIKLVEDNRTGINSLTGLPFSRPAGTGREGAYGQLQPTAPSLLEQLTQMSPQARLVRGLNGYNDVARYSTGDPVIDKETGKPYPGSKASGLPAALKFLGINLQSKKQLQETSASITATKEKNAAARSGGTGKATSSGPRSKW